MSSRVIETHFHADFVSGHLELADVTGATIWYGEGAEADFPIGLPADGEGISLAWVTSRSKSEGCGYFATTVKAL